MLFLAMLAALIGLLGGYASWALYKLIALVSNLVFFQRVEWTLPSLQHHHLGPWILVVPALGGLLVGLMAKYGTPKIRGHGIPEAMEAVLVHRSRIQPRVAILKPLSAAISIGTGGPFGAEGPIIQTGGAIGSMLGQLAHVTAAERRVLLACGAAAGMAGIFGTPIAAVILAIELLLFEFRSRSFIPLVIASTIATSVHSAIFGYGPLFDIGATHFDMPRALPWYVVLGLLGGFAATGISKALYWIEDEYEKLPMDPMWWPVIGGVALGLIGIVFPRVLGVGYDTIGDLLTGRLALGVVAGVLVFKTVALLVSLGSGTSGGLLAPVLMIGASLGSLLAMLLNATMPGASFSTGAFALVGMAAVFGSASRATFAFIIFAFELTRDYEAVLPLMIATVVADALAQRFMQHSIMTEKLARRGVRVHAEYEADPLKQTLVRDVMEPPPEGLVNKEAEPSCTADDTVHDAIELMLMSDAQRLLVMSGEDSDRVVGVIAKDAVFAAREKRLREERVRETGWIARLAISSRERE